MTQQHETTPRELERDALRARWDALLAEQGKLRIRDAAAALGVGEAQLLSTQLGDGVQRLAWDPSLFHGLAGLGEVMASTRNQWAVIEKHGTYDNIDIGEHVGLVLTHEIDLRLFPTHFHSAFAVQKIHRGKPLHSIQFFAKDGTALHKVYAKDDASREAMGRLVNAHLAEDQESIEPVLEAPAPRATLPDEEIDVETFQQEWRDLQDTHEFFGLLRRNKVSRLQAMRLAPEGFTKQVPAETVERMLEAAVEDKVSIMAFVGSPGCIEIHTGPINRVVETGTWINILDPDFNLHLNRAGIASAWVVRKPTEDGVVTSLELFDKAGETIVMFFGERKPGIPEDEGWRELVRQVTEQKVLWASGSCVGYVSRI
jgi:putative hemin transport protein